ncbi:MAG: NAD-dependent epimerase/dehydratase family protein [Candidatus Hodarchaeales archaeon]|jgi:nucleoside-diphosphate-sugar epimerase
MKILVTGASGFIGKALVKELVTKQTGHDIYCAVRKTSKKEDLEKLNVKLVNFDLTDYSTFANAIKGMNTVVHFAAKYDFLASEDELFSQNVEATQKLAETCLEAKIKHFIYCSSAEALGIVIDGTEESDYNPDEVYGRSKMEAEKVLLEMQDKQGLPLTIARPTGVYGPGDYYVFKGLVDSMDRSIIKRVIPGSLKGTIHWTYIDDIIQGFMKIIENQDRTIGEIFNLASDEPQTYREVFEVIATKLGNRRPWIITRTPMFIVTFFWPLVVKYYRRKGFIYPYVPNAMKKIQTSRNYLNKKVKDILGFNPIFNFEKGVEKTVDWLREQGLL